MVTPLVRYNYSYLSIPCPGNFALAYFLSPLRNCLNDVFLFTTGALNAMITSADCHDEIFDPYDCTVAGPAENCENETRFLLPDKERGTAISVVDLQLAREIRRNLVFGLSYTRRFAVVVLFQAARDSHRPRHFHG